MKKRILIVDDSPLVHELYGSQLEDEGFTVLHAEDGMSAINTVFLEMPDLILLDIHMPKINGYQVCRLLKDHPSTRNIPIIIVTSQSSQGRMVEDPKNWSFQTGADSYMDKDSGDNLVDIIRPYLKKDAHSLSKKHAPMGETEILLALSSLLDRQLYLDVTRLKELDDRKSAFVSNVSHEFKSPLAIIQGSIDLTLKEIYGPITEKQRSRLETVKNTTSRLSRLVTDLLDLAKIEAGKMTIKDEEISISDLIEEVLQFYAAATKEKQMKIKKEIPSDLPTLRGDKDRLTQVFINLFNNSLKFTPQNGVIIFRIIQEKFHLKIEIEDNGPGMDPQGLEKIFDKFERVTAEKREGTGLGLPIAKDIITLHGGKIWATSEEGKGSKFLFLLPLNKNEPQ